MADETMTRVLMEFGDGRAQELRGDAAQDWLRRVNARLSFADVHGGDLGEFPWQVPDRTAEARLDALAELEAAAREYKAADAAKGRATAFTAGMRLLDAARALATKEASR